MSWESSALAGAVSSMDRLIDLRWGPSGPPMALWPHRLRYRDALSSAFQLDALCLSPSSTPELKTLLGQPLGFGLDTGQGGRRWLSGIVTGARALGDEGGFSLIGLRVESALSLLEHRRSCRVFQEQSVPDIVATILHEHRQRNAVIAATFDLAAELHQVHAPRSYCVQFNESDKAFIERLLAEEGIAYRFAFDASDGAPRHTLILSDMPLPHGEPGHRLHYRAQADTVGPEERTLTGWQAQRQLIGSSVALASYDYQPAQPLHGQEDTDQVQGQAGRQAASSLTDYQAQTLYYADNGGDLDRYARLRLQAQELHAKTFFGEGRLRTLATGQGFVLDDHPAHAGDDDAQRAFVVTGLILHARNNLPEAWDVPETLRTRARAGNDDIEAEAEAEADADASDSYRSRFSAVRRDLPLVPAYAGALERPTAHGPQTATVVGPQGEEVFTDALGRIRLQFHWQRAEEHPQGTAAYNERSSSWVRVAMPSAGAGFGHQFVPRIGQEVLVDFLHGDMDRPVVVGVLYNGRQPPPAFSGAGELPGNRTLSGIRSREHRGSGYSELLMDDTPGQVRARLAASPHASELNLGKLTTPRRDGEAQPRGTGAELRSDAAIAVRAAQGLLLTTYARQLAQGAQLDRQELLAMLDECGDLFRGLGQTAAARGAQGSDNSGLAQLHRSLADWPEPDQQQPGDPVVAVVGASGIVTATPHSQLHYAGKNHDITASDQVQSVSGGATRLHAGKGVSLYAQEEGIQVIANQGKVLVQAQDGDIAANAQQNLQLSANQGEVIVTAPTIRLVADDGSYIRIGNGIEIGTPGKATVHAASHDWVGPKTDSAPIPAFGRDPAAQQRRFHYKGDTAALATGLAYTLLLEDGDTVEGSIQASGLSERMERERMQRMQVSLKEDDADAAGGSNETGTGS